MKILKKSNLIWISSLTIWSFFLIPIAKANIDITVLFQPPPESEKPENTEGAGSRQNGECPQEFDTSQLQESVENRLKLTAIVPDSNYGLTIRERPTFWIYLPKTSAQQAFLSIKEEGIEHHWQQSFNLTGKAGIMGITLSDEAPVLEIGKNYQWAIILVCGNRPNPNDPVVAAWIKRVDKSQVIDSELPAKTMLEQAAWYAQKGIWYDSLDLLITEKKSSLENWHDIWVKYLQSADLDEIANEPILSY